MKRLLLATAMLAGMSTAQAAVITWTDLQLGSANPVTSDGVTLTTTTDTGNVGFIGGGTFAGLYLGGDNSSGNYTLTFSEAITSIEFEFDALSSVGTLPVETLSAFAADGIAAAIGYTNQVGTTFDGTTVTSAANDGQGIVTFSGSAFSAFSFRHEQGAQAGFVIERLVVTTATAVPAPAPIGLALLGLVALARTRRRGSARNTG